MELANITIAGIGAIPLVIALVELVKRNLPEAGNYAQFIALFFGVLIAVAAQGLSTESIVTGIAIGLSASGLFSGTKAVKKKLDQARP